MPRLTVALLALALAAGCGTNEAAAPAASPAAKAAPAAATPSPTRSIDPACADPDLLKMFGEMEEEGRRGAFDSDKDVKLSAQSGGWFILVGQAKYDADLQLYKSLDSLSDALGKLIVGSNDPVVADAYEFIVKTAAATVILKCDLDDKYTFDD